MRRIRSNRSAKRHPQSSLDKRDEIATYFGPDTAITTSFTIDDGWCAIIEHRDESGDIDEIVLRRAPDRWSAYEAGISTAVGFGWLLLKKKVQS